MEWVLRSYRPLTFVRFREYNDWEGESWDFWLQLDGNEAELAKLDQKLTEYWEGKFDPWYTLHLGYVETEDIVDKLVEYAEEGYMPSANKVVGTFTWSKFDTPQGWFYKGGIKDFFDAG